MIVWTKACPRCSGDLLRMDDDYEPYFSCIQCGHAVYEAGELRRGSRRSPRTVKVSRPRSCGLPI